MNVVIWVERQQDRLLAVVQIHVKRLVALVSYAIFLHSGGSIYKEFIIKWHKHAPVKQPSTTPTSLMLDIHKHLEGVLAVICKSRDLEVMFANYVLTFSISLLPSRLAMVCVEMIISRSPVVRHRFQEFVERIRDITFMLTSVEITRSQSRSQLQDRLLLTGAGISIFRWLHVTHRRKVEIHSVSIERWWRIILFTAPSGCLQYWMDPSGKYLKLIVLWFS